MSTKTKKVLIEGCVNDDGVVEITQPIRIIDPIASGEQEGINENYQSRVGEWMIACFGETISADSVERNHRFLEEALELVQSISCTSDEAHKLVDYVFGRPVGEPSQEVGGVMVTLAALCRANELNLSNAAESELARVWTKVDQIREKQKRKPALSPLPGCYPKRSAITAVKTPVVQPIGEAVVELTISESRLPGALDANICLVTAAAIKLPIGLHKLFTHPITDGSGREEKTLQMLDGTPLLKYLQDAAPEEIIDDDWTRGYEECRRTLYKILAPQLAPPQSEAHTEVICESCGGKNWAGTCNQCIPY